VIPAHKKDFPVLRQTVLSTLRYIGDVRRVLVVANAPFSFPDDRVEWRPEPTSGLPTLADLQERWTARGGTGPNRASWVYQQLLKLGAPQYIPDLSPSYLCVDSDVIWLRPVSFLLPEIRFPYSRATEYHEPYRVAHARLLGSPPKNAFSFTAHHMLYDQAFLHELFDDIERHTGQPWHDAYFDAADPTEQSSINEQDVYGHWVIEHHPEWSAHRQLRWRDTTVVPSAVGRALLGLDFEFVAAHAYARRTRADWIREAALRLRIEFQTALGQSVRSRLP
jgi:hypothetical protein